MKLRALATCMAVACMATVGAEMALAQANFFVPPGGTGPWGTPTNWTLGHLPQAGETAIIQSSRVATIDIANPSTFDYLRIADNDTGAIDGTLNILPGASLNVAQQVLVGLGGPSNNHGVVNQSGGSLTVGDALFIAFDSAHTAEYNLSGGTVTTGNLWFRFGNGTLTQTGGTMNAQQLVLAEGGNPLSSSLYDLKGGLFNVAGAANIGKAPGAGDPFAPFSHGSMNISGGIATFGQLLFGTDATDQIHMFGPGILRVDQSMYSTANALADIAGNKITGTGLIVSTVAIGASTYTQVSAVPEPASVTLVIAGVVAVVTARGCRVCRARSVPN
jgi:hypothetical protein